VVLHDVSWREFERILAARGEAAGPRLTYLEGELELRSPSIQHEGIKSLIGRLIEAYADDLGLELNAYGSWTLKKASRARGIEPDECYVVGNRTNPRAPDLAIEVAWTSWSIDKLDVYRGLGVREVWVWEDGRIRVNVLRGGRYAMCMRPEAVFFRR
jgi:Uma2 family endonuclease